MKEESDPIQITRKTYDQEAEAHAQRFWSRSLDTLLESFWTLLPPGAFVLDVGCGPGRDTAALRGRGYRVIGLDLSFGLLSEAQRRVGAGFIQGDMRYLPFGKAVIDGVWMNASLLHIPKAQSPLVLKGIHRVMGIGSVLFLGVKQGEGEYWDERHGRRFFVYYQPNELRSLLSKAGLNVEHLWVTDAGEQSWIQAIARKG